MKLFLVSAALTVLRAMRVASDENPQDASAPASYLAALSDASGLRVGKPSAGAAVRLDASTIAEVAEITGLPVEAVGKVVEALDDLRVGERKIKSDDAEVSSRLRRGIEHVAESDSFLPAFSKVSHLLKVDESAESKFPKLAAGGGVANPLTFQRAFQSSTAYNAEASRAIDGDTRGEWRHHSVTHTYQENNPWLMIDLATMTTINRIVLYNRSDCCQERLVDAVVEIMATEDGGAVATTPPITADQVAHGNEYEFDINVQGQYIKVSIPDSSRVLSLAEVQVFGAPIQYVGLGRCQGRSGAGTDRRYYAVIVYAAQEGCPNSADSISKCAQYCQGLLTLGHSFPAPTLRGFTFRFSNPRCWCEFDYDDYAVALLPSIVDDNICHDVEGTGRYAGPIVESSGHDGHECYAFTE